MTLSMTELNAFTETLKALKFVEYGRCVRSWEIGHGKNLDLTRRELQIIAAVVSGYSNKDIANHFRISESTIKHHLTNIFDKVGVSTRLELALFALTKINAGSPSLEPKEVKSLAAKA